MYHDDGIFKKCDINPSSCQSKIPGSRDAIASNNITLWLWKQRLELGTKASYCLTFGVSHK